MFGETLSKGALIWYHNLPPNSIDSFAMLADSFLKAFAGAIKVATRKSDVFKIKQMENEMLGEFVYRFQSERMELPPVSADWAVQAFAQGLNERSSIASKQLKQNLIEYPVVTWVDVHNSKLLAKESGNADRVSRSNKERYQPYIKDRRNISRRNIPRNDRRADRGQSSRGLMSKTEFDKNLGPAEAPRLLEYNFNVDASGIVLAIGKLRDTRWPKLIQTNPSQRNPNLVCKYHGTHGHRTKDCRQLRVEVARLFNEGHLREFLSDRAKNHFRERDANKKNEPEEPQNVINMIIGGVNVPYGPIFKCTRVSIAREKRALETTCSRIHLHSVRKTSRPYLSLTRMH
uniref:Retrotransposon gag domain-containing protein n=2 Tax=Nicotiana TaxID=4085 RepID=A0A1S4BGM0_TOBAC|nr:PREDICTED: uncharacterized protein LOC104239122 [Nicotiana sylvestris]XP_016488002.1 PREDICTED: uncharacterized protein LOC107808037 [Nicotiana tabacum]